MADIAERYVEQLYTTAETLRRRFISYYDLMFYAGQHVIQVSERAKEAFEPASYDLRDHVYLAFAQTEPISTMSKDWRYTLVETYLGISVLMTGLSYGQTIGAYALSGILDNIFSSYMEHFLLFLIPIYVFFTIRKNSAMDDMERRSFLFSMVLFMGVIVGHTWPSVCSMVPAVHFLPPLVFALLIDNEFVMTPLVNIDRLQFFAIGAGFSTAISLLAGILPLGYISPSIFLGVGLHAAFFSLHCQLACQSEKEKTFVTGEYQFFYIISIIFLQLLLTALLGTNPFPKK